MRFFKIWVLVCGWSFVASAAQICDTQNNLSLAIQSKKLLQSSCVSTCSKILNPTTQEQLKEYANNCEIYAEQGQEFLTNNSQSSRQDALDRATLLCIPVAAKNTVVGTYELVKALPSMVGYLISGAWLKDFDDGERAEALAFCKGSPDCRRAMARTTIRFQNKNSDGTWKISDEEVDKQIASQDFGDLHRQAIHDAPLARDECLRFLADIRRDVSSDGEDWSEERHKKVLDILGKKEPHCPGVLRFFDPPMPEKKPEPLDVCIAKHPNAPMACLSAPEMFAVSYTCNGPLETCATVAELFLPVPGPGKVIKIFKGIRVGEEARLALREGAEIAEVAPARALTSAQRGFINSYKERVFVGEAQNSRFILGTENSAAVVAENKTRFFDVENSVMKKLNDKTNDKELVTSLTNYQKETVLKRLDPLKEKYPGVDFDVYADFKSVKIKIKSNKEIDEATSKRILADLNRVYGESNKEFAAKMKELDIEVTEAGPADQWFKAGYGRSVDEAATASRTARQSTSLKVFDFSSPEVREHMSARLAEVERQRQGLVESKIFSKLMTRQRSGPSLPREDVFDLVRKNENPDALAKAISQRYELANFTSKEAQQLQTYVKGVDEFSPTILIAKRETVNLDDATQGGLSADFLGMGSANLKATAEGIAGKDSLEQALIGAREGERKVTGLFKRRMEKFKNIVGEASCSGDDCAMAKMLSDKEKVGIMQKLARNPETRGVRMSFIGSNVAPEVRMKLASHGESIEKNFRKELEGKIPYSKLNKMTFGFDMKSTQLNQGSVNLVLGKSAGTRLTVQEQKEMQQAFARALEKHNSSKEAVYVQGTGSFTANKIYWMPGPSVLVSDEDDTKP